MKPANIAVLFVVCFLFFIALVATIAIAANADDPGSVMHGEFAIHWIPQALGVFIAVAAALALLLKCLIGGGFEEVGPLVLPLLAGLLLISAHWAAALSVGLITVAIIARQIVAICARRQEPVHAQAVGPGDGAA